MSDPLIILAGVTATVTLLTLLLARLIPDRYDLREPHRASVRPTQRG